MMERHRGLHQHQQPQADGHHRPDAALPQPLLASGSQARLASVRGRRAGSCYTLPEHLRAPIDMDRGAGDRARTL
jgi:hypothetical protein